MQPNLQYQGSRPFQDQINKRQERIKHKKFKIVNISASKDEGKIGNTYYSCMPEKS